jgi:hypothetical protein
MEKNRNYTSLNKLPIPTLSTELWKKESKGKTYLTMLIKNSGNTLALMINFKAKGKYSGQEILPAYWSDNYFSLLPSESKKVTVAYDNEDGNDSPVIECKAYNMKNSLILNP